MSISYPLTLPSSPIARISMSAATAVSISRSPFSYVSQVQQFAGQLWFADVTLAPMNRASAESWISFLLKLNGREGTFLLGDPSKATPRGSVPGTPLVKGAGQTGQTLLTDGWTTSQTGVLKAGDMIQIGQRIYSVLVDADSNGSGESTLDIWPRLRESPSDNATIITSSCVGLFRLANNSNTIYNANADLNYTISFSAEEAL